MHHINFLNTSYKPISDVAKHIHYVAEYQHLDDTDWLQQSESQLSHLQLSGGQTEYEGNENYASH